VLWVSFFSVPLESILAAECDRTLRLPVGFSLPFLSTPVFLPVPELTWPAFFSIFGLTFPFFLSLLNLLSFIGLTLPAFFSGLIFRPTGMLPLLLTLLKEVRFETPRVALPPLGLVPLLILLSVVGLLSALADVF
jgi:hypothetical protein